MAETKNNQNTVTTKTAKPTQATRATKPIQATPLKNKIRYRGKEEVTHHLYKLQVAKMIKDHGYDEEKPKLVPYEHTHVFHSVDSRGRPQFTSTPIGGHFHAIEVIEGEDGAHPILKIGPAIRKVARRRGKHIVKSTAPVPHDTHTHDSMYLWSEKLKPRKMNAEFAKMQSNMEARQQGNIPLSQTTMPVAAE